MSDEGLWKNMGHDMCTQLSADQFSNIIFVSSTKAMRSGPFVKQKVLENPMAVVLHEDGRPMSICSQYLRWNYKNRWGPDAAALLDSNLIDLWQNDTGRGIDLYLFLADSQTRDANRLKRKALSDGLEEDPKRHHWQPEELKEISSELIDAQETPLLADFNLASIPDVYVNVQSAKTTRPVGLQIEGTDTMHTFKANVSEISGVPVENITLLLAHSQTTWENLVAAVLSDLGRNVVFRVLDNRKFAKS